MSATHESDRSGGRYSTVSILLHWLIAFAILGQIQLGWTMGELRGPDRGALIQLHKSIGITILLLSLVRLAWRVGHPAPPLPGEMPRWEKLFARATHVGFYLLMIGMPLIGWLMVSANEHPRPMTLFGLVPWPRFPGTAALSEDVSEALHEALESVHSAGAWVIIALLALHVAGALKHHFLNRDTVLWRMLPLVPKPRQGE